MLTLKKDSRYIDASNDRRATELEIGLSVDAADQPTGDIFLRLPECGVIIDCDLDAALTLYFALCQAIEAASPAFKASTKQAH